MRPARKLLPANATLIDGYREDCQTRKITSYDHYVRAVERFMRWLEDRQADPLKVGKKELKDYLHYLAVEKKLIHMTLIRNFAGINSFYSYLEDADLINTTQFLTSGSTTLEPIKQIQSPNSVR